ncbi:MAG: LysM peptidoglycan-binding domain-containing protein [Anaerolineae bacterium]
MRKNRSCAQIGFFEGAGRSGGNVELRMYFQILWKRWWIVLVACLTTAVVVGLLTFSEAPSYGATATYIVTPVGEYPDAQSAASALDMLSRRTEIATTYAEVANSRFIKEQAADELGLSSAQRRALSVDSQLVAGTNILEIQVEGNNPQLVQVFTDMVGFKTATYVQNLYEAYSLKPLDTASLPSSPAGPSKMIRLALGGIMGLALGAGLAFLAYYLEAPGGPLARSRVPAAGLASSSGARRARGGVLAQTPERMVLTTRSRRRGTSSRRRIVGWIVAAAVILVLMAGGLAAWLSGRETSAASPPEITPIAGLMVTALWTGTATAMPTDTALPTAMLTATATSEPSPTVCLMRSGWMTYVVQAGDTLSSLASSYGISGAEIIEANCLSDSDISQMETLLLPPRTETPISTRSSTATVAATSASDETSEATATPSPTHTNTPSPTQTSIPSPTPRAPTPSPAPTEPAASSTLLPAPTLIAPLDQQVFQEDDEIVLAWEPVGNVTGDSYYAITVAYNHLGATWYDDVPWTHGTTWTLSEHGYLLDLSDDGRFEWSVQVVRPKGLDANGRPVGEALSAPSEVWALTWRRASSGGGQAPGGPTVPPPLPPP